ncbi:MAG: ABC transporter permease [Bifidobacteriaceae bacterium]|jgi:peptide/nickel transport system permease protein|nr:ABC transporter permease [Bifidobacteriaceae bacterium]
MAALQPAPTAPAGGPEAAEDLGAPGAPGRWRRFALRRAGRLAVSLWVLVTAAFLMIHLVPGDPVRAALGMTASPETVAAMRAQLGLDAPLPEQYWNYLRGLFTGDLGVSITSRLPVAQVIGPRLGATVALAAVAFALAAACAIPLGAAVAVATRRGRRRHLELGFAASSVVVAAVPDFLLGVMLVAVFSVGLGWLPVAGMAGPASFILPVLALAVGPAAVLARITRVEMLGALEADYVRTARAKRLSAARVNLGHALPNAVTATLTLAGLLLGGMVAGTVLVESVFAWPGLGSQIVAAIASKDYPLVQGITLVYGLGVLLINTAVDCALALLDPRSTIAEA